MPSIPDNLTAALADRYRLERELGGGGMSRVYLADEIALGRRVVIKVIAPELAQGLSAERFEREVKLAARLQQANIVPVLSAGEAAGLPYYVMPFVDGESLRARLRGPGVPSTEAVSLLRDVARALAYAHAQGVVHRDIKPENILLSGGAAVVTDFGIAKAISASRTQETAGNDATLTQAGSSIGTPAYMAPEQAIGAPVDHRADLYAWGVVAYEMLAGTHPFGGRIGTQQLIAAHIAEAPAPLSVKVPALPRSVADLVMQCLEKDPARRPATAEFLVTGLSSVTTPLSGEFVAASSRKRGWVIAGGVALLGLAAVAYLWKGRAATSAAEQDRRVIAVLPFRNLSSDTAQQYFSDGMTEEITSQLGKVAALKVLGRSATAPYEAATDRLQRMGRELGVGSVVDGSVRLAGNRVRINVALTDVVTGQSLWSEQYDRTVADLFALQDDVAHKVATALQTQLTDAEANRLARPPTSDIVAYQIYLRARALHPQARAANYAQADLLRQAIQRDSTFALAYAHLGRNYLFRAVGGEPVWMDSAFVAARRAIALDSTLADGYFALGDLLSTQSKLSPARNAYLKALQLSPSHGGAMADLANVYLAEGRYDEALDWSVRSGQIDPNHVHVPYHVGVALLLLGDDSVTSRYLLAAEQRMPTEPRVQALLAWLDLRRGDTTAALDRLRRVARNNPDDTEVERNLAEGAAVAGASDAEALLKPIVEADPNGPSQYSAASLRSLYALMLFRRGDTTRARALWNESTRYTEEKLRKGAEGSYDPLELAAVVAMEGRTSEALDLLDRANQAGYHDPAQMKIDPSFANLRQEPRYRALLARMERDLAAMRSHAAAAHPELFVAGKR